MDDPRASIPPQTFVECGECGRNINVSWFCKNCPISLCDTCARSHKTKRQYKTHAVVPRTYTVLRLYGPAKIAEQCRIHPEKEISTYCNDCDAPCCVSCLAKDHKRHDFSTIEDKYLDAEKRLNEYYRLLDTDVRPTLENMEEQARADVKEDDSHVEKVINDINNYRKDVVQNFNRACDDLIVQVKDVQSRKDDRLREIETSKEYLVMLKHKIEEKIERGNLDIISYVPPNIESLIPKSRFNIKTLPWFEPAKKVLDVIMESVGKIYLTESKIKESKNMRSVNVKKINSFKSKIDAVSIIKAGDRKAWVMDCSDDSMYLYTDKGKLVRSLAVEGSEGINDMVITQSGEMIVTCGDKKVRRISVSGEVSTLTDTSPSCCEGVCLLDKEEIVVCLNDQADESHSHLAVYSQSGGSKLRKIWGRDGQGKNYITDPYRVVQNGHDLCVVNEDDNVVCVNKRGDVRWLYDGKQINGSFDPCGICADTYNSMLVTDNDNHCVHYINKEGGLIQVILTKEQTGLTLHWGICVDEVTGHVWIGNISMDVVIAKYLE